MKKKRKGIMKFREEIDVTNYPQRVIDYSLSLIIF